MNKKKWWIIGTVILVIIVLSQIFIHTKYLYSPVTYPKGNISDMTRLAYTDFQRPLVIEAVTWDDEGKEHYYQYVRDEKIIKAIIKHVDQATRIPNYTMDQYVEELPESETNEKYMIHVRQLANIKGNEIGGRILFTFDFHKNHNIFKVSNARFFEFTEEFKEEIFSALSDESKWVTF